MNSAIDKKRASALTTLLRVELREARFSVTHLTQGHIEFVPDTGGERTTSTPEVTSKEELDAPELKALHLGGTWKRELFRSDIRVEALCRSSESAARREDFMHLLDDFGVLSEGHVAHTLGGVLPSYTDSIVNTNSPEKSIGVSATADLWSYLLVDACLTTPRRAAAKILRWMRGDPLAFETRVLLGGLTAASCFALASGLAVDRLPRKSDRLDGWFPTTFGVRLSSLLDRTMLRIPCQIAPVLTKPTKVTEQHDGTPFESWRNLADIEATWPLPLGGVHELARALSLVCGVAVETPMIWTDFGDHAHFGKHFGPTVIGFGELPRRSTTEPTLTADDFKKALRLQPEFRNVPDSVETAFRYWLKSKAHRSEPPDRLVFLRTALEALFVKRGNRAELTYRLATNGAWYTGRNRAERRQYYDVLTKVYGAASTAVHEGRVKNTGSALLKDGQEICRLALLKRLRSPQDPVWDDIVFGR